jgi:hypothetical protein
MSDAAGDVLGVQPAVDGHRPGKCFDQSIGLLSKSALPGLTPTSRIPVALALGHQVDAFFL